MTAPATWKFGTISRCAANVLCAPYTVLDFDGMDGSPPRTREDLAMHLHASLALILWMREALDAVEERHGARDLCINQPVSF